ncbi:hypothetical protein D2Q93_05400 [Alicyclobacillaceae bacterium I2511]|nr:hypothetical protein D2Q93_05400 [Alicyclobacillaceae bacterium I2511]
MSNQLPKWVLHEISDADEPGDAVYTGMRHRDFDGVMLLLLPDGEPGDTDWYGTEQTADRRPTRPLLLFYRGKTPEGAEAFAWAEKRLQDGPCSLSVPSPTKYDDYQDGPEATRTVAVHLNYPPYPWLTEARLGMEMGRYFDAVELTDWIDPTETKAGAFTYRFYRRKHEAGYGMPVTEIDDDDLPY